MFKEIMSKLTDEEKMKIVNIILSDTTPVIDIENRHTGMDFAAQPLIYDAKSGEIHVEFREVKRETEEKE